MNSPLPSPQRGTMIHANVLVSIHDVMPSSFAEVKELVELCQQHGVQSPTLLVVPGLEWSDEQVAQIRRWHDQGLELAGHGWIHRHGPIKTWWHRFHSMFLSRNVAEHLSLPRPEVIALMNRCGNWFDDHSIPLPKLYVPPAWALGAVAKDDLKQQPFEMVETFRGVFIDDGSFHKIPLLGYEADTLLRSCALSAFNRLNWLSARSNDFLRMSIHPFDHRLRLRDTLRRHLAMSFLPITYTAMKSSLSSLDSEEKTG